MINVLFGTTYLIFEAEMEMNFYLKWTNLKVIYCNFIYLIWKKEKPVQCAVRGKTKRDLYIINIDSISLLMFK